MTSTAVTTSGTARTTDPRSAGRLPSGLTVLRWELRKLAAQGRARYTLLGCLLAPALVVVVLNSQQRPPKDTLYGPHIHDSGYAMPLLILGFAAQWVFPLLTALVAGDIFASEDHHGTWKTVLTRSASRAQLFWAKTLAAMLFALSVLVLVAASTIVTSLIVVGRGQLIGLTGQLIPSGTALPLVIGSWGDGAAAAARVHSPRHPAVRAVPQPRRRDRRTGRDRPDHAARRQPRRPGPGPAPAAHV
ncbi:MAG: hypothetical protein JWN20_838, partial [Jatrophihabitantaceae bacterium]|nr:hypothetical protein [Jatrophihabitantaceae bacterium]